MSIIEIHVCDGCGKELLKPSKRYHLRLETDEFWLGADYTCLAKELDFCESCAQNIKSTLEKIANRLNNKEVSTDG